MHQSFFVKLHLFGQNAVNRSAKRCPMHARIESPGGPSLEKAAGNSIADLKPGDSRTDRYNLPCSIRQRHASRNRIPIVLSAKDDKVTIIERDGFDSNQYLMIG
jgi:hypothetical protein